MLGTLLPLLAIAASLNTVLDYEGVAAGWVNFVKTYVTDKFTMMLGINILLLIVGCLMDAGSAIIVFSPCCCRSRRRSVTTPSTSASS